MTDGKMAPKITRLINLVGRGSSLSEKGMAYFDSIRKVFTENQNTLPVKISMLSTPAETMALEHMGKVILITPSEGLRDLIDTDLPYTIVMKELWNTYTSTISGTHQMLQFMLVTPDDYEKLQQMITAIKSFFIASSHTEFSNTTIADLKDANLMISTNSADVNKFIASIYPHAVPPRADMGFVLYQRSSKDQPNYNEQKSYFDQSTSNQIPIACVTGFTEPVQIPGMTFQSMPKFLPVVHISSMITPLPDNKLTTLLIPLASDVFIRSGLWKNQLSQFSKDQPNIGKLIRDPHTNMPWFAENPMHRDQIIDTMFEKPSMVLDITEGTYRIPGLENYGIAELAPSINQMYANFLNAEISATRCSGYKFHEYIGTISRGSIKADSRWADYLNTIVHYESEVNTVAQFLMRTADPKVRVNLIKRFHPSLEILYSNIVAEINLKFMMEVQELIRNHIHIAQNNVLGGTQQLVDLASMIASGQQFSSNPGFNYGSTSGVFDNPFGIVYRS